MRCFFNLAGAVHDPDDEGFELADLSEARIQTARFAGEYLRDRPEIVWLGEEFRIEVTDRERAVLFTFIAVGVDAPARDHGLRAARAQTRLIEGTGPGLPSVVRHACAQPEHDHDGETNQIG